MKINSSNITIESDDNVTTDFIKEKKEKLDQEMSSFEKILPFFQNIMEKKPMGKEAQVFEGLEGIKSVRETFLKEMKKGEIIYYIGNPASGHKNMLGYWDDFNSRRVRQKVWSWTIYNQDAVEFGERRKKLSYTKVKYLPHPGPTPAWIEIYGDTVAIALKEETPMSIVVTNKLIADSFKTYFKILWEVSKEKI